LRASWVNEVVDRENNSCTPNAASGGKHAATMRQGRHAGCTVRDGRDPDLTPRVHGYSAVFETDPHRHPHPPKNEQWCAWQECTGAPSPESHQSHRPGAALVRCSVVCGMAASSPGGGVCSRGESPLRLSVPIGPAGTTSLAGAKGTPSGASRRGRVNFYTI
jgi:hypothetical protein